MQNQKIDSQSFSTLLRKYLNRVEIKGIEENVEFSQLVGILDIATKGRLSIEIVPEKSMPTPEGEPNG